MHGDLPEMILHDVAGGLSWLDHWGSARDGTLFVSEPYQFDMGTALQVSKFCERLSDDQGVEMVWRIDANGYWNPGSTVRIVIYEYRPGVTP